MVTSASSASEIETAVKGDCRKQGVDNISIKRIVQDYDTQLLRIIRLFQKSGFTTTFSSDSLRQLGGGNSQRGFKSRTARLLSDASGLFESHYVAKLVRQSGLFDQQWYEDQYPDVKSARIDPVLHYVKFGAAEGRNPSGEFDTLYYLSKHRDLVLKKRTRCYISWKQKGPKHKHREQILRSEISQKTINLGPGQLKIRCGWKNSLIIDLY